MMLHYLFYLLLLQPSQGNLELKVTGIEHAKGVIRIGLYNHQDYYLKKVYRGMSVEISNTESITVSFLNVPWGTYSISIFHDVNSNGKLDSNLFRIPKEPYGFSNNAKAIFGPPSFDEASFKHQGVQTNLTIKL